MARGALAWERHVVGGRTCGNDRGGGVSRVRCMRDQALDMEGTAGIEPPIWGISRREDLCNATTEKWE
jgi:hypothetical protein